MNRPRPMQRRDRELSREDTIEILEAGGFASLATVDADGAPYVIPLSYVMMDGKLYVHTGTAHGHFYENVIRDNRVCLTVVGEDAPIQRPGYGATRFASVVAAGRIYNVDDPVLFKQALARLARKYWPKLRKEVGSIINNQLDVTAVWAIELDEVRGKERHRDEDVL
ncbi:pyridoxamine 5'-phosphate oxidase family protein [Olsenella sp. KGMB02461]|nr:pyridoxamine 5'-phosphate oxidase family protein [Olsenella sp. KGMB02461]